MIKNLFLLLSFGLVICVAAARAEDKPAKASGKKTKTVEVSGKDKKPKADDKAKKADKSEKKKPGNKSAKNAAADDPFDEGAVDGPDTKEEDEFEDDSAFEEKQAAVDAARDEEIEAAKAAARREALKNCPKPKRPSKGLMISQAAMTLGGTITGAYDADIPVDGSKTVGGGSLTIWPEVGIFATKGLLLSLGIGFKATFGDITESLYAKYQQDWWNTFGFDLGVRYIFDTKSIIYPYLGLRFGLDIRFAPDPPQGEVQWEDFKYLVFAVPVGVMIKLSRHVALDIGLQFEYDHSLNVEEDEWAPEKFAASQIHLPFGYMGIHGFFPTKRN